jgi:hypothetical protein
VPVDLLRQHGSWERGFLTSLAEPRARARTPPSDAAGSAAGAAPLPWTLEEMRARPEEFRKLLQRSVLGGCCVEVGHGQAAGMAGPRQWAAGKAVCARTHSLLTDEACYSGYGVCIRQSSLIQQAVCSPPTAAAAAPTCCSTLPCLQMRGVIMLEAPEDAQHIEVRKLRFESFVKRYFLHYVYSDGEVEGDAGQTKREDVRQPLQPQKVHKARHGGRAKGRAAAGGLPGMVGTQALLLRGRPNHYGSGAPHEALFEGFFLDAATAKQYIALYRAEAGCASEAWVG